MKETEMANQEHTIAVVEPVLDGDTTLHFAKQAVERGGRASVMVLLGRETVAGIAAYAEAEDLTYPDGREIYIKQLARNYSELFDGREHVTIVTDGHNANRVVFDSASKEEATTVVVPQRLVNRRGWRASVAKSPVPVVIAPPAAA